MLWSSNKLRDYTILTRDGEHAPVVTTLFDEAAWEFRYLIAKPDEVSPAPVMIASTALKAPNRAARALPTALTAQQVKNSPTIVMNMLMTPSTQKRLNACYPLYQYWAMSGYATSSLPLALIGASDLPQPRPATFRDVQALLTMTLFASDGAVGPVRDVIVADDGWAVRFLAVANQHGKSDEIVWIPPKTFKSIEWDDRRIAVDISRQQIRQQFGTPPQEPLDSPDLKEVMPMPARVSV